MIRVLLADDETMMRAGIGAILATDGDIEVVAEAADGAAAVDLARRYRPDVALLDIRMPVLDGIAAAAAIRRENTAGAVAMLTTFGEDDYIVRALAEGANGFLLKSGDPRELLAGVRAVAAGGAYLSPPVTRRVIGRLGRDHLARTATAKERVAGLTGRERDVLRLLGDGLSNAQIGRRLGLVEGTVKAHVSAILLRLGARNRVQAAIVAHEAGLLAD
jgi:DNA-binding NarL/FixJ family response regulator